MDHSGTQSESMEQSLVVNWSLNVLMEGSVALRWCMPGGGSGSLCPCILVLVGRVCRLHFPVAYRLA